MSICKRILLLVITIFFIGCAPAISKKNDEHSAKYALDWVGVYSGVLPCASCSGIETTIILLDNQTYTKTEQYLDSKKTTFKEKGNFIFTRGGSHIQLQSPTQSSLYQVGENRLQLIGDSPSILPGALYILKKNKKNNH